MSENAVAPQSILLDVKRFVRTLAAKVLTKEHNFDLFFTENDGWYSNPSSMFGSKLPKFESFKEFAPNILIALGYMQRREYTLPAGAIRTCYVLTEKAFALLEAPPPISSFISYQRASSSALALYTWAELRNDKFDVFFDVRDITAGDEWHALLERRVKSSNVFIVVIGEDTFNSRYVKQEIEWALEDPQRPIIPLLHQGVNEATLRAKDRPFSLLADKQCITINSETSDSIYSAVDKVKGKLYLLATEGLSRDTA